MNILIIHTGEYGKRHAEHVMQHKPDDWIVHLWEAPDHYPIVIDYPEDFIPEELPPADLLLSFTEHKGVAELLPEIAKMTSAKSVIAPIDNEAWLPRGLARQLRNWLADINVPCATPKPLCSLTENSYLMGRGINIKYESKYISEFARFFGKPKFNLEIDTQNKIITNISVERDAVCGCARYVAENLIGIALEDATEKAGLLHHHYPCLASMGIDADFDDTLLHVSGNIMKDEIYYQLKPHLKVRYYRPSNLSE